MAEYTASAYEDGTNVFKFQDAFALHPNGTTAQYVRGDGSYATFPSIPTVNNGTLTIKRNNTSVGTFSANQSSNTAINITVPTNTSDLNNDSNFATTTAVNNAVTAHNVDTAAHSDIRSAISTETTYRANGDQGLQSQIDTLGTSKQDKLNGESYQYVRGNGAIITSRPGISTGLGNYLSLKMITLTPNSDLGSSESVVCILKLYTRDGITADASKSGSNVYTIYGVLRGPGTGPSYAVSYNSFYPTDGMEIGWIVNSDNSMTIAANWNSGYHILGYEIVYLSNMTHSSYVRNAEFGVSKLTLSGTGTRNSQIEGAEKVNIRNWASGTTEQKVLFAPGDSDAGNNQIGYNDLIYDRSTKYLNCLGTAGFRNYDWQTTRTLKIDLGSATQNYVTIKLQGAMRNGSSVTYCYPLDLDIKCLHSGTPVEIQALGVTYYANGSPTYVLDVKYKGNVIYISRSSGATFTAYTRLSLEIGCTLPNNVILSTIDNTEIPSDASSPVNTKKVPTVNSLDAIGSTTKPVYVNANGNVTTCDIGGMKVITAAGTLDTNITEYFMCSNVTLTVPFANIKTGVSYKIWRYNPAGSDGTPAVSITGISSTNKLYYNGSTYTSNKTIGGKASGSLQGNTNSPMVIIRNGNNLYVFGY